MMINPEVTALVETQYKLMKEAGVNEAPVKEIPFMLKLNLYINKKPKNSPFPPFIFEGDEVYIGTEEEI